MHQNNVFLDLFRKQENLAYITSDLESPIADVKADICNLPFEDNSFDIVFCNHVLEHIPDDTQSHARIVSGAKTKRNGDFSNSTRTSREKTFEDDTITDKKERVTKSLGNTIM